MHRALGRALAVGVCVAGLAPGAGATDLKVSGVWTAYALKNKDGQNVCGVRTAYPDGRRFYIAWFEGETVLTVQVVKESWEIPPHVQPKLSMNFPGAAPWTALGLDLDHVTDIIEVSVPNAVVRPFTDDISRAQTGTISFGGGDEPPWELSMAGFPVALQAMVRCIDDVAGPDATTTPYAYLHAPVPGMGPVARGPAVGSRSASDMGKGGME